MSLPDELKVGLKEWAAICRVLEEGRQMILIRKGGIHESGGEFELEHPEFLLFPTYLHQNISMLKPIAHAGVEPASAEPARITLSAAATVTDIIRLQERQQMDRLDPEHVWTPDLAEMRFNYRPENPLYLLIVRTYRLSSSVTIDNTPAYAGCKSWVPLDRAILTAGATPVLSEDDFHSRRNNIVQTLGRPK